MRARPEEPEEAAYESVNPPTHPVPSPNLGLHVDRTHRWELTFSGPPSANLSRLPMGTEDRRLPLSRVAGGRGHGAAC